MKASDVTDEQFLAAMDTARELRPAPWVSRWVLGAVLDGDLEWVRLVGEADRNGGRGYPELHAPVIPEKVILAKARRLIRRGLINGCACGCRGDFTKAGWE